MLHVLGVRHNTVCSPQPGITRSQLLLLFRTLLYNSNPLTTAGCSSPNSTRSARLGAALPAKFLRYVALTAVTAVSNPVI
jgi:hypothetical protein